jgi:hypothetical protein
MPHPVATVVEVLIATRTSAEQVAAPAVLGVEGVLALAKEPVSPPAGLVAQAVGVDATVEWSRPLLLRTTSLPLPSKNLPSLSRLSVSLSGPK